MIKKNDNIKDKVFYNSPQIINLGSVIQTTKSQRSGKNPDSGAAPDNRAS